MKIRTQFAIVLTVFGLLVATCGTLLFISRQRANQLRQQQQIAQNVEQTALELGYLSNGYLLFQGGDQVVRWEPKFALFSDYLARLEPDNPEQQDLVTKIKANQELLNASFANLASKKDGGSLDRLQQTALILALRGQMETQTRSIGSDAQLLMQKIRAESDQLNETSEWLIVALVGLAGAFLVADYALVYRHTLRPIAALQAGTRIIDSGNLDYEIAEMYKNEVGDLARAFNRMTSHLKEITASRASLEREIAERQQIELQLKEVAEKYSTLFNTTSDGVLIHDLNGELLEVNDAYCRMSGYSRAELIHMPISTLEAIETPSASISRIREVIDRGGHDRFESRHRRKDGSMFDVDITALYLPREGGQMAIFVRDITEHRQAIKRIEQLNRDLEQRATELEIANQELDSFSYSVSHDLRSPLATIAGFSRLLEEDYAAELPQDALGYLELIRQGTRQMEELIQSLLVLSRLSQHALEKQTVNMNMLVTQALEAVQQKDNRTNLDIQVQELPAGQADPVLLKQVWVNLISNAVKFTRKSGHPRIEIGYFAREGTEQVYYVRDNGVGFDMKQADKLFRVFQRLHGEEEFEGTGVGLAIVARIIRRHGGRVWAEGEVGKGATFYFTLA